MNSRWLTGCFALALLPSLALAQAESRRIEVRGTGEVTAPADELRLPIELTSTGADVAAVKQRNDLLLRQIFDLVATQKLTRPAIESTVMSFDFSADSAERDTVPGKGHVQQSAGKGKDPFGPPRGNAPPVRMSRRLTLRFDGIAPATALLAKLTAMDSVRRSREVRLSPLQAGVQDPTAHQQKARAAAVKQAQQKATELADAGGLQLGAALAIFEETSAYSPRSFAPPATADPFGDFGRREESGERSSPTVFVTFQEEDEAAGPDRLPPAQVHISVTVRIVYEATAVK